MMAKPRIRLKPKSKINVVNIDSLRVNKSLVDVLEETIYFAKTGQITTMAFCYAGPRDVLCYGWEGINDNSQRSSINLELDKLKADLITNELLKDYGSFLHNAIFGE